MLRIQQQGSAEEEEEDPEELSAVPLPGALGADCYHPCLGPRQVHQGKRRGAFVTLLLMAGHFLSLSSMAGMGSERKTEPFFYFPSFCKFCVITKSHIAANFPALFTRAFHKGTGIPL